MMSFASAKTSTAADHNQEARAVWDAYYAGEPVRPPVALGTNTQFFIFYHYLNPGGAVTFKAYTTNAQVVVDFQHKAAAWRATHIAPFCDDPIGIPDEFTVKVDLQNFDESAYFGAPVTFLPNQVPDTLPILSGDRKYALFDLEFPTPDLFFADDSIQMISPSMLQAFFFPVYRKLKAGVTTAERVNIHLCGDASHHFKALKEEIGVYEFEIGFPIDLGEVRRPLGPEAILHGGPSVMLLRDSTPDEVRAETRRILDSGVLDGGRFVLREGNNLAPHTPFENLEAMYQEARSTQWAT